MTVVIQVVSLFWFIGADFLWLEALTLVSLVLTAFGCWNHIVLVGLTKGFDYSLQPELRIKILGFKIGLAILGIVILVGIPMPFGSSTGPVNNAMALNIPGILYGLLARISIKSFMAEPKMST